MSEQVSRYAREKSPAGRRGRSSKATKISALRLSPQSGWISFWETEEPVGSVAKGQETTSFRGLRSRSEGGGRTGLGGRPPCTWGPSTRAGTGAGQPQSGLPRAPSEGLWVQQNLNPQTLLVSTRTACQPPNTGSLLQTDWWLRPSSELLNLLIWAGDKCHEMFFLCFKSPETSSFHLG